MANKTNLFSTTLILSLLLLATSTTACSEPCRHTPSPRAPFCPTDTLKLNVCVDILGLVGTVPIGSLTTSPCCAALQGLSDMEVAACLCTCLKANMLGINLSVSVAMSVLVNACQKTIPDGFSCE